MAWRSSREQPALERGGLFFRFLALFLALLEGLHALLAAFGALGGALDQLAAYQRVPSLSKSFFTAAGVSRKAAA